jgi:cell division protease FtsH
MTEALGPLAYGENEEEIFLGREITQHKSVSEETARAIDQEIRAIVDRNDRRARDILTNHKEVLENMAQALLDKETIDGDEVENLIKGMSIEEALKPRPKKKTTLKKSDAAEDKSTEEEEAKAEPSNDSEESSDSADD